MFLGSVSELSAFGNIALLEHSLELPHYYRDSCVLDILSHTNLGHDNQTAKEERDAVDYTSVAWTFFTYYQKTIRSIKI
jgi:hypothetical protein